MSDLDSLRTELNLVDQAASDASSCLEKKKNYCGSDWEIGMTIGGTNGDTTPTPFITIIFKTIDHNGNIAAHPVTMTPQQFADFSQNVSRFEKSISAFN